MKLTRALLVLYSAEGFFTIAWISLTRSEAGRALFLWLSLQRLILLALALLLWATILATTLLAWRSPTFLESVHRKLDTLCQGQQLLGALLILIVIPAVLLLAGTLAVSSTPLDYTRYRAWAPETFPLLHSLVFAVLPLLLLAIIMAIELAVYLGLRYRDALSEAGTWAWSRTALAALLLSIGILTVFYWLVLIFQLRFFVNNPAWYWKFEPIAVHPGDLIFFVVALSLLGVAYWTLILHQRVLVGLAILFILGLFLQLSVGLMSAGGFAAFRDRYFSSYHKTYISKATQGGVSILEGIRQYEQLYGTRAFTNTKPPGLMAFYNGLDHLINGYPATYPDEVRYERLASLVTYSFPILAVLCIFAVYTFARRYVPGGFAQVPVLAAFLLVLCPSLMLFSLFPDQAIYPLLFLFGASLIVSVVGQRSLLLGFVLGLFLYLAVFFAFTLLPLYPFAVIYLLLDYWMNRRNRKVGRQLLMACTIAAGTLLLYGLFRLLLNYDFIPRFARAVAINHNFDFYLRVGSQPPAAPESFPTRLGQIVGALWLNHLDFAAAIGFPIYILFAVQAVLLLRRLWAGCTQTGDVILGALLLSFIVLNLAGTAQGEVPRLWLFWLPMVVILAAMQIESWTRDHPRLLLGLALVQLITLWLTFHFQDLRM